MILYIWLNILLTTLPVKTSKVSFIIKRCGATEPLVPLSTGLGIPCMDALNHCYLRFFLILINEVTLGLTVPNQADMVKPILCCVQPHAKISESCQLPPEGSVTLHLAEICSVHRTQGSTQVKDHLLQSPAQLGWVRPTWAAPQANSSCTALHFLPNTPDSLQPQPFRQQLLSWTKCPWVIQDAPVLNSNNSIHFWSLLYFRSTKIWFASYN